MWNELGAEEKDQSVDAGKACWAELFCPTPLGVGVPALGDKLTQTLKPTASLSDMRKVAKEGLGPHSAGRTSPSVSMAKLVSLSPNSLPSSFSLAAGSGWGKRWG